MDGKTVGIIATLFFLVGGFGIFVSTMPPEFLYDYTGHLASYPSYWKASDMDYQYFLNKTLTAYSTTIFDFNTASPSIDVKLTVFWNYPLLAIKIGAYRNLPSFPFISGLMFENDSKILLDKTDLVNRFDSDINASRFSPVYDGVTFSCTMWFADTDKTRNDIGLAWNGGALDVGIAFGISNVTLKTDAWNIIGRVLTFQAPEIFGSGTAGFLLNALIALPLWGAIAALILIMLFELIPF